MSGEQVLELAGREVRITSPGKVLFGERGETKLDLVRYYAAVAEPLMRAMGGRPVLMQRFPQGAGGPSFFQKRVPENIPEWLETTTVQTVNGTPSRALVAADVAHVAWAVNLACLGFHVWPLLAADPEHADELRLDLDPQPGTGFAEARVAARELKALLDELGIAGFVKTTGNRGLHVYVRLEPRWDSYEVRSAAVAAARELERRRPDILTAAWWKEERGERIFLDYNQNAPHKTVFGAWSVRARVGAQVSTPIAWEELEDIDPAELTLATVPGAGGARRRSVGGDRASVARAAARDARARPRERAHGRAVAAGLPEAAGRAAARRSEPGAEAVRASLRTRPASSHSTHSRWAASRSSSARRPICAAMSAASAANASASACAVARCARLWSSCHVTTSPARSSERGASRRAGVSQTVSASGIAARSAAVSGGPSSSVNAKRPPGRSAAATARDQRVLVLEGEHRLEQEHDVEGAGRAAAGPARPRSGTAGRPRARGRGRRRSRWRPRRGSRSPARA